MDGILVTVRITIRAQVLVRVNFRGICLVLVKVKVKCVVRRKVLLCVVSLVQVSVTVEVNFAVLVGN